MGNKDISTLIEDINKLLEEGIDDIPEDSLKRFSENLTKTIIQSLKKKTEKPTLRMSNIGRPCVRQTWLEIHESEKKIPFRSNEILKFLFGNLTEDLLLFLVEAAGHTVTGRQTQLEIEGVKGSRDVIIDGVLVDVKSASTYSFKKFKEGKIYEDDPFGYYGQIQTYLAASQDDPLLIDKDRCAFLVLDKTLGHICLDIYPRVEFDVKKLTREKKEIINNSLVKPDRAFEPVPDGKSGNMKLGINCSYCSMKRACYPELRTFLYSYGPVDLITVVRTPDVLEVNYNEI